MLQEFNSAMTSINSKKLPAVYNKINWIKFSPGFNVLDYGCGRYTDHIRKYISRWGGNYYPYDPYWMTKEQNKVSLNCHPDIIICANVFNVIKEAEIIDEMIKNLLNYNCPVIFSIYEGNKSGIGKETKKGCWQRNEVYKPYLWPYLIDHKLVIYHNMFTSDRTILL